MVSKIGRTPSRNLLKRYLRGQQDVLSPKIPKQAIGTPTQTPHVATKLVGDASPFDCNLETMKYLVYNRTPSIVGYDDITVELVGLDRTVDLLSAC